MATSLSSTLLIFGLLVLFLNKKQEAGERIVLGSVSDFPTPSREWRAEPAPQLPLPVPYLSV